MKMQADRFNSVVSFPDVLDIDENRMSVWVPFADGNARDGVGDLIEVGGIVTERHAKNPVVLFEHGKSAECSLPIAMAEDPLSKAYAVVCDEATRIAKGCAFFYQGGDSGPDKHAIFCEQLFHLVSQKFVRGGSIGYQVILANPLTPDYSGNGPPVQGLHLLKTMMLEFSIVVIPANGLTVKTANDLDKLNEWRERAREILCLPALCGKSLALPLRKSLEPYAAEGKVMSNGVGTKGAEQFKVGDRVIDDPHSSNVGVVKEVKPNAVVVTFPTDPDGWITYRGSEINDLQKKAMSYLDETRGGALVKPPQQGEKDVPKDTEASVNPPLTGNLSETNVPPARWKPGVGAEQMKKIRAKYKAANLQIAQVYQNAARASAHEGKSINVRFKRKVVKGYASVQMKFDVSGMDTKKQNLFVKEMKDCGFGHPSGGRWSGEGDEKALDAPLKTANYAFDLEPGKNLAEAIGKAQAVGEKHGAKYLGNTKTGANMGTKAMGPDEVTVVDQLNGKVVGEWNEPNLQAAIQAINTLKISGGGHTFSIQNRDGRVVEVIKKSIGANMKTKSADGQLPDEVQPVEEEKSGPAEFHLKESLGSQVLKRFHEDHSALMSQYDEILPVLDHADVKAYLEEKLKGWEKDLSHVEKSHKKWFKDVEPIAGSMDEGEYEDKDHLPGEIDNAGNADSDPVEEVTPDEAMEGMEKVDDEETPEEKALRIKQTKSIRAKYRKKDIGEMPTEEPIAAADDAVDGVKWFKGLAEHQQGHVTEAKGYLKELGETPDEGFTHEHRMKAYHHGTNLEGLEGKSEEVVGEVAGDVPPIDEEKAFPRGINELQNAIFGVLYPKQGNWVKLDEVMSQLQNVGRDEVVEEMRRMGGKVEIGRTGDYVRAKSMTKDLTENEAEVIKDEMVEQADDNVQKSLRKAVKNAAGYLKELAGAERFSEDERQKAMKLCKDLEEIEAEAEDDAPPEDEGAMQTKAYSSDWVISQGNRFWNKDRQSWVDDPDDATLFADPDAAQTEMKKRNVTGKVVRYSSLEKSMQTKAAEEIEELKEKALARSKQMDELSQSLKRLEGLVK